jgi:hypothetical protein
MVVVFLAFWSMQGRGFTWCLGGNGLELVSTSSTRPNGDNLRLATLGAWPVASVSSDAIPFTNPIARAR